MLLLTSVVGNHSIEEKPSNISIHDTHRRLSQLFQSNIDYNPNSIGLEFRSNESDQFCDKMGEHTVQSIGSVNIIFESIFLGGPHLFYHQQIKQKRKKVKDSGLAVKCLMKHSQHQARTEVWALVLPGITSATGATRFLRRYFKDSEYFCFSGLILSTYRPTSSHATSF